MPDPTRPASARGHRTSSRGAGRREELAADHLTSAYSCVTMLRHSTKTAISSATLLQWLAHGMGFHMSRMLDR